MSTFLNKPQTHIYFQVIHSVSHLLHFPIHWQTQRLSSQCTDWCALHWEETFFFPLSDDFEQRSDFDWSSHGVKNF